MTQFGHPSSTTQDSIHTVLNVGILIGKYLGDPPKQLK